MPRITSVSLPINVLRGIVPTATTWDTDPTSLANCTDGDHTTVTGTGSKVMGAAGYVGYLNFDLGSIKTFIFGGKVGLWSTAGSVSMYVTVSDDDITYSNNTAVVMIVTTTTELAGFILSKIFTGQYIRLSFYAGSAATANAKIYEVMAYEVGI